MAKEQRRYTDAERATLVAMLVAEGYPDSRGALQKVSDYAKVSPDVLRRWFKRTQNPPPATLVGKARASLAEQLEDVARNILDEIPSKLAEAELYTLTNSLSTLIDKIQLLTGQPTEHQRHDINGLPPTDAERVAGIAALAERARARGTGSPPIRRTDD